MTLSPRIHEALNDHLGQELYASHAYLAMAGYFDAMNLPGFAHWMRVQSDEERGHAMKFYEFLNDRGAPVTLQALEQPPSDFSSPLDVFERALAHEQEVSTAINRLYGMAAGEQDYAAQAFLQWFVTEQVEEEKAVTQIIETLKMIGENKFGLLMLDRELARRGSAGMAASPGE